MIPREVKAKAVATRRKRGDIWLPLQLHCPKTQDPGSRVGLFFHVLHI